MTDKATSECPVATYVLAERVHALSGSLDGVSEAGTAVLDVAKTVFRAVAAVQ